jgi:hypothetical protein
VGFRHSIATQGIRQLQHMCMIQYINVDSFVFFSLFGKHARVWFFGFIDLGVLLVQISDRYVHVQSFAYTVPSLLYST